MVINNNNTNNQHITITKDSYTTIEDALLYAKVARKNV